MFFPPSLGHFFSCEPTMQCAACHHSFEPEISGEGPVTCPACGSLVAAESTAVPMATIVPTAAVVPAAQAKPAKPAKAARGRGALNDILVSFLLVAAILVAVEIGRASCRERVWLWVGG